MFSMDQLSDLHTPGEAVCSSCFPSSNAKAKRLLCLTLRFAESGAHTTDQLTLQFKGIPQAFATTMAIPSSERSVCVNKAQLAIDLLVKGLLELSAVGAGWASP
jgi:hypothetical protein